MNGEEHHTSDHCSPGLADDMQVLEAAARDVGGFSVRRVLPHVQRRMVGPFIFVDHMGPRRVSASDELTVRGHPHIGLATVTYLFDGELWHRDNLGFEQSIRPGAVNWMTAGHGIAHSERTRTDPTVEGVDIEGIQTWVALPVALEETEPSFVHHDAGTIPEWTAGGCRMRLIAGEILGYRSPVDILSPMFYLSCRLERDGSVRVPVPAGQEGALYVAAGRVQAGGRELGRGTMICFPRATDIIASACGESSRVMILGGEPFRESRHIWWNFVSSSKQRIADAARAWDEGRFDPVINEAEYIPLPDDRPLL